MGVGEVVTDSDDREPSLAEATGERTGGLHHPIGVGGPAVDPVEHGESEGSGLRDIEVRRESGMGDGGDPLSERAVVSADDARGWPAKALVGAHRHEVRALGERRFPAATGEHAAEMGGIEQQVSTN